MNRRRFIKTSSVGGVFSCFFCMACGGEKPAGINAATAPDTSDPCADLSELTATDLQLRKSLSYAAESPYDDQLCNNCQFWIAPKEGRACGGCVSIKGPIHPEGYCSYWAPQMG